MFQFPGFASLTYVFSQGSPGFARRGCPIRRSTGKLASSKPWLIAGSYVLHRLSVPRHPPHALTSLVKKLTWFHSTDENCTRGNPWKATRCIRSCFGYPCIQLSKIVCNRPYLHCRKNHIRHHPHHRRRLLPPQKTIPRSSRRRPLHHGGDDRDRTDDLRLAKPALSQLSYIPRRFGLARAAARAPANNGGPEKSRTSDLNIISVAL